jgi:twitching motility protein PilJ
MFKMKKKNIAPDTHPLSAVEDVKAKKSWFKLGQLLSRPKVQKASAWSATSKGQETKYTVNSPQNATTSTQGNTEFESKHYKPMPVIGGWSLKKQYTVSLSIVGISALFSAGAYFLNDLNYNKYKELSSVSQDVRASTETLGRGLERFVNNRTDSFDLIARSKENISAQLLKMIAVTDQAEIAGILKEVKSQWDSNELALKRVSDSKKTSEEFRITLKKYDDAYKEFYTDFKRFSELAIKKEMDEKTRQRVQEGFGYMEMINQNVLILATADEPTPEASFKITKGVTSLKGFFEDMEKGNEMFAISKLNDSQVRVRYEKMKSSFLSKLSVPLAELSNNGLVLLTMKESAARSAAGVNALRGGLDKIAKAYEVEVSKANGVPLLSILGVLLGLSGLLLTFLIYTRNEKRSEYENRATLARNQQAVLQLLTEMDPIRDGDLTRKLTVMDQFTATIADAINATTEDLGYLVKSVQKVSENMTSSSDRMSLYSKRSVELSKEQLNVVNNVANGVASVGNNLSSLAVTAEETSELAQRSMKITTEGGLVVQKTLEGIKNVREKVNETQNRVVRLKETSEQISEILSTIRDIAEKTNVLAINANLEATRAGAAGKGFTVVANSVKELASQASEATRKVGALIDSVKSDIENAAKSMTETAEDMKEVARSSEVTGESFIEIEEATIVLSESIQEMRNRTLSQAEESNEIRKKMQTVVDVVAEVSRANETVNESAAYVTEMSKRLLESTEKFKV